MKQKPIYAVIDPQLGMSCWSSKADAELVAKHRRCICKVQRIANPEPGTLVSTLGAPDYRIPEQVPWVEVDQETAYGTTCRLSRSIRVF